MPINVASLTISGTQAGRSRQRKKFWSSGALMNIGLSMAVCERFRVFKVLMFPSLYLSECRAVVSWRSMGCSFVTGLPDGDGMFQSPRMTETVELFDELIYGIWARGLIMSPGGTRGSLGIFGGALPS